MYNDGFWWKTFNNGAIGFPNSQHSEDVLFFEEGGEAVWKIGQQA